MDLADVERARAWVDADPDPDDASELGALIHRAVAGHADALAELGDRMDGDVQFGTAGLRAAMGPGSARMNTAVVTRAAWALAAYLRARVRDGVPRVVVGFDARHRSAAFARTSAEVLTASGCAVELFGGPLPTPVLAHAVRAVDADAGVMVTASHNPAVDNGYKVYLGGRVEPGDGRGAQLVPPADADIAALIAAAPPAIDVPVADGGWTQLPADGGPDDPVTAYLDGVRRLAGRWSAGGSISRSIGGGGPRVVLTAMHGVGARVAVDAFLAAGLVAPILVTAQAEPDPDFPTVAFPNPEEPGALDLALAEARSADADLLVALDPDADRCCVAVPDVAADGGWRVLTGDQLGALLGTSVLDRLVLDTVGADASVRDAGGADPMVVASSIVSGDLLSAAATARGATAVRTLTGFKWLARVPGLTFAYEEALGYCCDPDTVHDKDGISAAVVAALTAGRLAGEGRTLLDLLDDLERDHGVHLSAPVTLRLASPAQARDRLAALRAAPPRRLGDADVVEAEDLASGSAGLPPTDALVWRTASGDRVVVRPSGTEPKLKCYLQVVQPVTGELRAARDVAAARMRALADGVRALLA